MTAGDLRVDPCFILLVFLAFAFALKTLVEILIYFAGSVTGMVEAERYLIQMIRQPQQVRFQMYDVQRITNVAGCLFGLMSQAGSYTLGATGQLRISMALLFLGGAMIAADGEFLISGCVHDENGRARPEASDYVFTFHNGDISEFGEDAMRAIAGQIRNGEV